MAKQGVPFIFTYYFFRFGIIGFSLVNDTEIISVSVISVYLPISVNHWLFYYVIKSYKIICTNTFWMVTQNMLKNFEW